MNNKMKKELIFHPNTRKMIKYLNKIDMIYSYVDCYYDEHNNSLHCGCPDMLFSAHFFDFKPELPFDKNVKGMEVLEMLKMLNHCDSVLFQMERPCMGPYKDLEINY